MTNRLLWTICLLLTMLIRVQGVSGIYEVRLSKIEDGLRRMDDEIYVEENH